MKFLSGEIFEWRRYKGTEDQRDLATYIMRNSCRLKTVKICFESDDPEEQLEMVKKLAFSPRASSSCEIVSVLCPTRHQIQSFSNLDIHEYMHISVCVCVWIDN